MLFMKLTNLALSVVNSVEAMTADNIVTAGEVAETIQKTVYTSNWGDTKLFSINNKLITLNHLSKIPLALVDALEMNDVVVYEKNK